MQSHFDSVLKTPSYCFVSLETMPESFRRSKRLKMKRLTEKDVKTSRNQHLKSFDTTICKIKSGNKIIFQKKKNALPSLLSCLHIHYVRQLATSNSPADIFVNDGSLSSHHTQLGIFSDESESTIIKCLKNKYSSRKKDNEFCKPTVLNLCEENKICDISQIMQERYFKADFEKEDDVPCNEILVCRSDMSRNLLRIMRVEGNCECHGKPSIRYRDILLKIVLSRWRTLKHIQMESNICTAGFVEFQYCWCVSGPCASELANTDNEHRKNQGDSDIGVGSVDNMIYIIMEEERVDVTLLNFTFNTAFQAVALFKQVAFVLAVAEENCEFEHRNLIRENIGVKSTNCETFCYTLNSCQYDSLTAGLQIVVMDFTCSRMTYADTNSQAAVYHNLDLFVKQVSQKTDGSYDVYQRMKNYIGNNWKTFEPYTNILWLEYLLDILLVRVDYTCPENELHMKSLRFLQCIRNIVRGYRSAVELVVTSDTFCNFP